MKSEEELQRDWDNEAKKSVRRELAYAAWCMVVAGVIAVVGIALTVLREYMIWWR